MECQECQLLLVELACGELDDTVATRARHHLDSCESCQRSLGEVQQAADLASEPPHSGRPLAAAANRVASTATRGAGARDRVSEAPAAGQRRATSRGVWQVWLEFAGRLAMGRQVGVVTVMMVVVAVGVWYVPQLRDRPEAAGASVVNPDPAGEAAPSAELTPAEPLDLSIDARRRRIAKRGTPESPKRGELAAHLAGPARAGSTGRSANNCEPAATGDDGCPGPLAPDRGRTQAIVGEATETAASNEERQSPTAADEAGLATGSLDRGTTEARQPNSEPQGQRLASATGPASVPSDTQASSVPAQGNTIEGGSDTDEGPDPTVSGQKDTPAVSSPLSSTADFYTAGLAHYRAAEYADAARDLERVVANARSVKVRTTARLYLARSYRALSQCATAVGHYEALAQEFPNAGAAAHALVEAAGCYRVLRRFETARQLLERASQIPSVEARARRELQRLE